RCPKLGRDRFLSARAEAGQRLSGEACDLVERFPYKALIAAKRPENIRLDRRIVRTGHVEFIARRDDQARNGAEIIELSRGEGTLAGHHLPQSNRLARRCFIWAAT